MLFNNTSTTEIYTLSLHDALPICGHERRVIRSKRGRRVVGSRRDGRVLKSRCERRVLRLRFRSEGDSRVGTRPRGDRKSTRLNSSHVSISYAVFCLKKKKKKTTRT